MKKDYDKILIEIYTELYRVATPSANFAELMSSGEAYTSNFFLNYFLDDAQQNNIIKDICKKYKLSKADTSAVLFTVMLGCSPTSSKKGEIND